MRQPIGHKPAPALGFPLWRGYLGQAGFGRFSDFGACGRFSAPTLPPPGNFRRAAAEGVFKRSVRQFGAGVRLPFAAKFERVWH